MAGEFTDKVVVISGGSRGIGRAIAESFARAGASTVLAAASPENLAKAAGEIAAVGPTPVTIAGDLRTIEACERVFHTVRDRFGRCDILVNNAGATRAGNFADLADDAWTDGFALKFFACVRLSRLFWPMVKAAQGHVLNIIGGAARTPSAEFLIGGSVNGAVANFSKGLAALGKQDGVNVNVIHPGMTETDRITQLWRQTAAASGRTYDEVREETVAKSGPRGIVQPADVAALALFLCSERARQIQGVAVAVDGGSTPGLY
jgi:3-oxoacyl-[acyl-carrier protein] reductase